MEQFDSRTITLARSYGERWEAKTLGIRLATFDRVCWSVSLERLRQTSFFQTDADAHRMRTGRSAARRLRRLWSTGQYRKGSACCGHTHLPRQAAGELSSNAPSDRWAAA